MRVWRGCEGCLHWAKEPMEVEGFGMHGARFRVRVQGAGCRVQGAGCRVQCAVCSVQGAGCRVKGAGLPALGEGADGGGGVWDARHVQRRLVQCVCVFVCERESERERERVCVCECVCVCEREREREGERGVRDARHVQRRLAMCVRECVSMNASPLQNKITL